ncbi:MAG TPA: DHH family phosphoesterase, partial [Deltaproteobacteria bacterium]|nr:DHH family phosphoesterase [Deltaproteobacteria bacterium]
MEVITSHIQADFDAFASMLAARRLYPGAVLVFPGSQEKNLREFTAQTHIDAASALTKLKAIDLARVRRLVIVDTRQTSRIGEFGGIVGKKGVEVIVYDHHPASPDDITSGEIHVREYGANSTLMVEVLRDRGIVPTPEEASVLAMGIFEDTGSLLFPSTTPEDCIALADLIRFGADLTAVSRSLARELSPEQVDVLDQLIKNAYIFHVGGIDVLVTTSESKGY